MPLVYCVMMNEGVLDLKIFFKPIHEERLA